MIADEEQYKINGKKVHPASGICSTYNLIYCFLCTLCLKPYVGRTVQKLNTRCNGHRAAFYKVLRLSKCANFDSMTFDQDDDDLYSLGLHLIRDHGCLENSDFNSIYRVFILETCSPASLEVKEHKYIHLLDSLQPNGINKSNPFNLPVLRNRAFQD